MLSRLVPHKQIEDALEAIAELRPRMPDLHLDVLGGGWWEQRLVDHAALLGISDAVTFHGHVDDADQTPCTATGLGARAAVTQGGLGAGSHRGRRSIACRRSVTGPRAA